MRFLLLCLGTCLLIVAQPTHSLASEEILKNYRSARSVAMGGTFVTTSEYGDTLFGNPARLSLNETRFTALELTSEINPQFLSNGGDLSRARSGVGGNILGNSPGIIKHNQHLKLQNLTSFFLPKLNQEYAFGAGLLIGFQSNISAHYNTDIDTQAVLDVGPAVGFSRSFFSQHLLLGINVRLLYRAGTDAILNASDYLTSSKRLSLASIGQQGIGFDSDIGAFYDIPWSFSYLHLALGGSINNILATSYNHFTPTIVNAQGSNPPANNRTYNGGMRIDFPDFSSFTHPLLALEMLDLGATTKQMSLMKSLHVGGEIKFLKEHFSLRVGLNQGYLTGGLGLTYDLLGLDFSTYGEELASNVGLLEDRRFVIRLAVQF